MKSVRLDKTYQQYAARDLAISHGYIVSDFAEIHPS